MNRTIKVIIMSAAAVGIVALIWFLTGKDPYLNNDPEDRLSRQEMINTEIGDSDETFEPDQGVNVEREADSE